VAVLAIDPSSPISQGSLLGDRIRMESVAENTRLYVRSVPSGPCRDGLCRNIVGLLDTIERAGFDDVLLETVGVGQINYDAHRLVDTFVLLLIPGSGDTIQAMKAGILEMADIYVINRADVPGAERIAAELRSVVQWRSGRNSTQPPVIMTSMKDGRGMDDLSEALDAHYSSVRLANDHASVPIKRRQYQLRALLTQRLDEIIADGGFDISSNDVAHVYNDVLRKIHLTKT